MSYPIVESPAFMDDLVVYELTTKNFNSPGTPQTGTFRSVAEKWNTCRRWVLRGSGLMGTSGVRGHTFYNIWAEYACIRPDALIRLGTEADFKALIDKAHQCGIKVFLDVITHGLMNESLLVKRKAGMVQRRLLGDDGF